MLDSRDIKEMESYVYDEDRAREFIIGQSRLVLKNSKSAIYSVHRKELKIAKKSLEDIEKTLAELRKVFTKYPHLKFNADNAMEEFTEASIIYGYAQDKKVPSFKKLGVDPLTYLCGLADASGELARKAVIEATAKNTKEVESIRDFVDEIFGLFIRFDLRNGDLRKKSDAIKWNLNKVEELLYDLKRKA